MVTRVSVIVSGQRRRGRAGVRQQDTDTGVKAPTGLVALGLMLDTGSAHAGDVRQSPVMSPTDVVTGASVQSRLTLLCHCRQPI